MSFHIFASKLLKKKTTHCISSVYSASRERFDFFFFILLKTSEKCYESRQISIAFSLAEPLANTGILLTHSYALGYSSLYSHHRSLI